MERTNGLSESLEDYLEVIYHLEKTDKVARAKDIAQSLGLQRGSVTSALKNLKERNLINYEPYSFITLTEKGKRIGEDICNRHKILKDFFLNILQVDPETADRVACRLEHAVDGDTMGRFVDFVEFLKVCPRAGDDWLASFTTFCKNGRIDGKKCQACIEKCKDMRRS